MHTEFLTPSFENLTEEYVLIQAWKKTVAYIRYHNWYADTLELDLASVNLPRFIGELSEQLSDIKNWTSTPLRLVPAPKNHAWSIKKKRRWGPEQPKKPFDNHVRPLAHVNLKDQVASTALMLCLADNVETSQGCPELDIKIKENRHKVISYGNRLFCDVNDEEILRHRWGSSKLYRSFYLDYKTFVERSEVVVEQLKVGNDSRYIIFHSDISKFYDKVRPNDLLEKCKEFSNSDNNFLTAIQNIMSWTWNEEEEERVQLYAQINEINEYSNVSLPQGLVASGFFANVVLSDFDDKLRFLLAEEPEIMNGVHMMDACRYVDDIRLVLKVENNTELKDIKTGVFDKLQSILTKTLSDLTLSDDKTNCLDTGDEQTPLIRQSIKMNRINEMVSSGYDATKGLEILNSVQALGRSQSIEPFFENDSTIWKFSPVADLKGETVARFTAGKFRSIYRSIRPLLDNFPQFDTSQKVDKYPHRTQNELDEDARIFSLGLIQNWLENPSNVRILRIGLDIWPCKEIIKEVFDLIDPKLRYQYKTPPKYTVGEGSFGDCLYNEELVCWYCIGEIYRAAATETGMVADDDQLSESIDLDAYRKYLVKKAINLIASSKGYPPWYVSQQILLFLSVYAPGSIEKNWIENIPELKHYKNLIGFLNEEKINIDPDELACVAILARNSYSNKKSSLSNIEQFYSHSILEEIANRDLNFAQEIMDDMPVSSVPDSLSTFFGKSIHTPKKNLSLIEFLGDDPDEKCLFRNELEILKFSALLLELIDEKDLTTTLFPHQIELKLKKRLINKVYLNQFTIPDCIDIVMLA